MGSSLAQQAQDDGEGLLHAIALIGRVDPEHEGVAGQGPGPDAEHDPTLGEVVEQHEALGDHERVVVGQ